jgi:hypothetical protein
MPPRDKNMQIISSNTTWTTGQTINLTDSVQVAHGATLTIEPGVIVNGVGGVRSIQAFGTVSAIGRPDATIVFNNINAQLSGNRLEPGNWIVDFADLNSSMILWSPEGGVRSLVQISNSLVYNTLDTNSFLIGSSIYLSYNASGSALTRNALVNIGQISVASSTDLSITENLFVDTGSRSGPFGTTVGSAIRNDNGGISVQIHGNTFQVIGRAAVEVYSGSSIGAAVNASENYFGTTDSAAIDALILDRNDSLNRASFVTVDPVLSAPDPDAPFWGVGNTNDVWAGSSANNRAWGNAGSDTFRGKGGDDRIEGGTGIDAALYSGNRANFVTDKTSSGFSVNDNSGTEGRDFLVGVERLRFTDKNVALDLDGAAGSTVKLLGTLMGPQALTNLPLVGTVLSLFDSGFTVGQLSDAIVANGIMTTLVGSASNQAFVQHVYKNIVGGPPSPETSFALTGLLDVGVLTKGAFLTKAADLPITASTVGLSGLAQTGLDFM